MIDIYVDWIANFAISGFRLDTAKHVNNEFWNHFVPAMQRTSREIIAQRFFIFGEVYDQIRRFFRNLCTARACPRSWTLDSRQLRLGLPPGLRAPSKLAEFFAKDGYYTTPRTNAYGLVTFLGNHDVGRIAYLLAKELPTASDDELLAREISSLMLCFSLRGIPVIYYGDEQGFTGKGGDAAARQDMFGSQGTGFRRGKETGRR